MRHLDTATLDAWLTDPLARSPADHGVVELIVRRPHVDHREVVDSADLDPEVGLVGDNWSAKGSTTTPDGRPNPAAQLTLMNVRVARLVAVEPDRIALAGDQLYVDLDLSEDNLPAGTRVAVGGAVIEISAQPHTGCSKFRDRFGTEALRWVSTPAGRRLRLRGVNTRIIEPGAVSVGDPIRRL